MGTPIRRCDRAKICEVEGKVLLRREMIERGGSSEAWYGGRARRLVLDVLFQVRLAAVLGGTYCSFSLQWVQRVATPGYPLLFAMQRV